MIIASAGGCAGKGPPGPWESKRLGRSSVEIDPALVGNLNHRLAGVAPSPHAISASLALI